jgi:nucleoside-diphosphate-sugar epimerase
VKALAETMVQLARGFPEYRKAAAKVKLVKVSAGKYYGKGYQDVQHRVPKIANTMADLRWKPRVGMKEALKRIFESYRRHVAEARHLVD